MMNDTKSRPSTTPKTGPFMGSELAFPFAELKDQQGAAHQPKLFMTPHGHLLMSMLTKPLLSVRMIHKVIPCG